MADFDNEQMDVDPSQPSEDDDVSEELSDGDDVEDVDDVDDSDDSDIDAEVRLYEKYAEILGKIAEQSYEYDNYVQLVQVAHQINDLDKIRESCELFNSQFPLAPEIWTKWLQIELSIATTEDEVKRVHGLLKRALADYYSVAVGGLHSQLADKSKNPQEIWDEVISTYGLDCMEGSAFFKDWRSFYTKHVPESPEKTEKLLEMFKYELSLPLAGIQEVYAEFGQFCDNHKPDMNRDRITETYHKSKDNLFATLKFEEQLVSLDDKEHHKRATVYSDYIEKCKTFLNDRMVQILYERMVAACCLNATTWMKYIKYLKNRETKPEENEKSQVFQQTPLDVVNRALRNCTWSADLYIEKIRLLEKSGVAKADVTNTAQQAFGAISNDLKGYLNIWLEYLAYIKRNTNVYDEKEVDLLRKTMELGQDSLASRSADEVSAFDQLCARIEYTLLKNGDLGYQHFDKVLKNYANQHKSGLWIDFAHLDSIRGVDATRRIFRRAIKVKNIDDFDTVMTMWKSFEYTNGTADQIRECNEICDKIIDNYNRYSASAKSAKMAQKRKPEGENEPKVVEKKQKFVGDNTPSSSSSTAPPPKPFAKPFAKPMERKKPEEKSQPAAHQEFGEKDNVSVFLSNLSLETTKEEIIAALPELNIKDVTLVVGPGGTSKGFGYLELSNPSEMPLALKLDRSPIGGRPMFISNISREKNNRPTLKYSEGKEPTKIFVKGLPFDATKEELETLFRTCGTIKDIRMAFRKDGQFKGIAYIDYATEKAANNAVATMDSSLLREFKISVAISNPPPRGDAPRAANSKPAAFPGLRAAVPRGDAKPRLSFIPSAVQRNVLKPQPSSTNGSSGDKPSTSRSNDYFRQLLAKK